MIEQEKDSALSRILAAGRTRVVRALSRAVGMPTGSQRSLQLGDLEQRVLYSATPIPVPAEAEACVVCEAPEPELSVEADTGTQLVVVDASTADYQSLVEGLSESRDGVFEVVVLDPHTDGIEQITEILSERAEISAMHIVSHGVEGEVRLGSAVLNNDSLAAYSGMFGEWHEALTHDADILFYGCDLAGSEDGRQLINSLSILSGADVAASDDVTGNTELGGDWDLEVDTGEIETDIAFTALARSAWMGTLSTPPSLEIQGGATTVAGTSVWLANTAGFDLTTSSPSDIEATFTVDRGTLTIRDTTSVELVAGDYFAGQTMTIAGSEASIEQAMADLIYTSESGFTGTVDFTATIDDLSGGLTTETMSISVIEPFNADETHVIANSSDDELNRGARRGVTRSVSLLPDGTSVMALTNSVSRLSTFTVLNPDGSTRATGSIGSNNARHVSIAADASDPAGSFVAVWTEGNGTDDIIKIQRFSTDGTPSPAVARTPIAGLVERNPSIDMNRGGDYAVVWESGGGNIRFQRFDRNDQPIDPMAHPIPGSNGGENPAIGIDADRNVVVSWDDAIGQYYAQFDGTFHIGTLSTAASAGGSAIAMNDAGQAVITWHEQGWDVYAQKIDANGQLVDSPFVVPETSGGDQLNPSVAIDEAGNFAIAWEGQNEITMRRFAWDGTAGVDSRIDADGMFNDNASIAMLDEHNFVVLYTESTGNADVLARRFTMAPTFTERPEVVLSASEILTENGVTVGVNAVLADSDSVVSSLSLSFVSSRPDIVDAGAITFTGTDGVRALSIPVIAGARGTTTIDVTATDANGNTRTQSVDIVVPTEIAVTTGADELDGDVSSIVALFADPGGTGISLREAITAANNTGNAGVIDRIVFDLPAGHVMTVATSLPHITEAVEIDGLGSSTPVVLDGGGVLAAGLTIADTADGSTISGLVVRDFGHAGIHITANADNNLIRGNKLGSFDNYGQAVTGEANQDGGIYIEGSNNVVGGSDPAFENVLSGNGVYGLQIAGAASGNLIQRNLFGTDERGVDRHVEGTQDGLRIVGSVTGTTILDNKIRAHDEYGISIFNTVSGTTIRENRIIGNGLGGVWLRNQASGTEIGGAAADGNVIAWNGGAGIKAEGGTSQNTFRGNRIHSNSGLGIDLGGDGSVQMNDALDVDLGANSSLNFPTLLTATITGTDIEVTGDVQSVANSLLTIDVYVSEVADSTGYGEAETYLGEVVVTTDATGYASISHVFSGIAVTGGSVVTATATDTAGNTSEFSQNIISKYSQANEAPVNVAPEWSRIAVDEALRFSAETGNRIRVYDADAGFGQVQVELMVDRGVLSLGSTSGVSFVSGDGVADDHIVIVGTVGDLNLALEGLTYTPEAGFGGEVHFTMNTDDLGSSGSGGALTDSDVFRIQVGQELETQAVFVANDSAVGDQSTARSGASTVAILPDGSYVIVWTDDTADGDGTDGVYARIFNPDGSEKVGEFRVAPTPSGDQSGASVVADGSGRFAVVWTDDHGGGRSVFLRRFDSEGVPVDTGESRVNTPTSGNRADAHVAVNRDGLGVIVWEGEGTPGHGIYAQEFDMATGLVGANFQANTNSTATEDDARVAINNSGDYVISFERDGVVWAKQFPNGDRSGTEIVVDNGSEATVAISEAGDFVVAYRFDSSPDLVKIRAVSSSGVVGTAANADPLGTAKRPYISTDGSGSYLLTYEEDFGFFSNLYYRRIVAAGSNIEWIGSAFGLDTVGTARRSSVAMSDAGNAVVVYTRDAADGTGDEVVATSLGTVVPNAVFVSTEDSGTAGSLDYDRDDLLALIGQSQTLESPTTSGDFVTLGEIGSIFSSSPNLTGFHFVTDELVVGSGDSFGSLQKGDWLITVGEDTTLAGSGTIVEPNDIVLIRPAIGGSVVGLFFDGIADPSLPDMALQAFTLVEKDTWVADTLVSAGTLLFTPDTAGHTNKVYVWQTGGVGSGTDGYAELLIDGDDVGITQPITAIELAEDSIDIGGQVIGRGTLALSTRRDESTHAAAGEDVFVFTPTSTTLGSGTTAGTSYLLFDGDDIGLGGPEASLDGLSIVGELRNHAPVLNSTGRVIDSTEKDTETTPQAIDIIVRGSASDPDNDSLGVAITGWSGNGILEYRLAGGSSWFAVGSVTESNALLLGPDAELRYRPDGVSVETADLSFRAWDLSSHAALSVVDTTMNGGETSFSSAIDTVYLEVTEVSFAPQLSLSAGSGTIDENEAGSVKVADINVVEDGLRVPVYSLQGADSSDFSIVDTGAGLELHYSGSSPDFESKDRYEVTVVVSDPVFGVSDSDEFVLNVRDLNETPMLEVTQFTTSIAEQGLTPSALAIADIVVIDDALGTNNLSVGGADGALFQIVGTSLVLRANVDVDYESRQFFEVIIELDDPALVGGALEDHVLVRLDISDTNDTAPVVTTGLSFSLDEDRTPGTFGAVTATDADTVGALSGWQIENGTDVGLFSIDSASGELSFGPGSFDFESVESYTLEVTVFDGVHRSAIQTVTIDVNDIDDVAPEVTAGQVLSVGEDASDMDSVGFVVATDDDTPVASLWNWTIENGNVDGIFQIASGSGEITIADNSLLDYESRNSYVLQISVYDGVQWSAHTDVTININDANDERPVISPGQSLSVGEAAVVGSSVGVLTATDSDTPVADLSDWRIESGGDGIFGIRSDGEIYVADTTNLDYESTTSYSLEVSVSDGVNRSVFTTVTVDVIDQPEAPPVVHSASFDVSESEVAGFTIGTLLASYPGGTPTGISWDLADDFGLFSLSSASGQLSLIGSPDHETQSTYALSVTVADGSRVSLPATITVNVLNENDNHPVIQSGQFMSIPEDSSASAVVGTVAASDADGDAVGGFAIIGGNVNDVFAIDSATGQISVANPAWLDYEVQSTYSLSVSVSDGTHTTTETVVVEVTDVDSEMAVSGLVFEDLGADGLAGANHAVTDAIVYLYLDDGDGVVGEDDLLVRTTSTSGVGYSFVGLAKGTYFVVVDSRTVSSTSDDSPAGDIWAEQTWGAEGSLRRNGVLSEDGFVLGGRRVAVSDDASKLVTAEHVVRVELESEARTNVDFGFSFDVVTNTYGGNLADHDNGSDRTVQGSLRQFILNANAIDGANHMKFTPGGGPKQELNGNEWWRITVTDELPVITGDDTTIDGTVHNPANRPRLNELEGLQFGSDIVVGPGADGIVGTADDIMVQKLDAPKLEIYNDRSSSVVGVGLALSGESGAVRNIAISGFGIASDDDSGNIRVTGDKAMVEESLIGASVGSLSAPPAGERSPMHNIVVDGADDGLIVGSIIAFAGDTAVELDFDSDAWGIAGNQFLFNGLLSDTAGAIDIQNGSGDTTITGNFINNSGGAGIDMFQGGGGNTISNNRIMNSGRLSTEGAGIRLWGTGNTVLHNSLIGNQPANGTSAGSIVVVGDHNATAASTGNLISQNYFENTGGLSIDLVAAGQSPSTNKNGDGLSTGAGYQVGAGNEGIDAPEITEATSGDTGLVVVLGKTVADGVVELYGAQEHGIGLSYLGSTTANGSGGFSFSGLDVSGYAAVTATTTDGTGNTSEFGNARLVNARPTIVADDEYFVEENKAFVTQLNAVDSSVPVQALDWIILGGADAAAFEIDSNGVLSFVSAPDFESPQDIDKDNVYRVVVKVVDTEGAASSKLLSVVVLPVNEHAPVFTSPESVTIPETEVNVLSVNAIDADSTVVAYSLSGGADKELFEVDPASGELRLVSRLDFDRPVNATNSYEVEVTATDAGGLTATQTITISIADVNDETPQIFDQSFTASEAAEGGAILGSVAASDLDSTGALQYSLLSDGGGLFEVDPLTGVLRMQDTAELDYETAEEFQFDVEVNDGQWSSVATIRIIVTDANEAPTAIGLSAKVVRENAYGAIIGALTVDDVDADDDHTWVISDSRFEVTDGVLKLKEGSKLDYEKVSSGVLAVDVTATDIGGLSKVTNFEIVVEDEYVNLLQGVTRVVDEDSGTVVWDLRSMVNTNLDLDEIEFEIANYSALDRSLGQVTVEDGKLSYKLNKDMFGREVFDVRAHSKYESTSEELSLDVIAVNDAPVGKVKRETVAASGEFSFDPLASDVVVDVEGDELSVVPDSVRGGVLNPDGTISYRPETGVVGATELTYEVSDSAGLKGAVTVDITVVAPGLNVIDQAGNTSGTQLGRGLQGVETPETTIDSRSDIEDVGSSSENNEPVIEPEVVNDGSATTTETTQLVGVLSALEAENKQVADNRSVFDPLLQSREGLSERAGLAASLIPLRSTDVAETDFDRRNSRGDSTGVGAEDQSSSYETYQQAIGRFGSEDPRLRTQQFTTNLEEALEHVTQDFEREHNAEEVALTAASSLFGGFSVGYLLWLLRGGSLVASMLTSIPAWRMVDPLPIMDFLEGSDDDEDSLDALIERNQKLLARDSPSLDQEG